MREFELRFADGVVALRWWIILITLALVGLAASGGQHLRFTTDYRVFFSPENPQRMAFEELEGTYAKNDNVMFVVAPAGGDVFTHETLRAVEWLTEQAWQVPYSSRVDSLSNFQHTRAEADDLIVADLVANATEFDQARLAQTRRVALNEPLLVSRLVSPSGHVTAVNVTVQLPGLSAIEEVPEVVAFARDLAAQFRQKFPQVEVRVGGMVMMNNAFSEASMEDMTSLVPLSFGLMLVTLAFLLKFFTGTAVTMIVILCSILTAMGLGGHLGVPITPPSASAPTIILTVAVANSVHVLVSFLHAMRTGMSRNAAVKESLRVNVHPVFLASLTTALGFLSMNFSEVPPFVHLGNLVAIGVVAAFFLSVTFLPSVLCVLPIKVKTEGEDKDRLMGGLGDFVVRRRGVLFWVMAAVIVGLVSFVPNNELNDVFVEYFDERVEFRRDSDFTTANLTGLMTVEYSLIADEPGGISEPQFLHETHAFTQWLRDQPEVMHVNSLTDIMRRLNKNMHGDDPAYYRLPDERDLSAQYLLLYEMSLPYGLDLNNQINVDKSSTRLTASLRTISTNEMLGFEQRVQGWLENNAPSIAQDGGTGPSMMFAHIGKRNIVSMLVGTSVALVLISLVLIVALRSVKVGFISMVPNLVPAAMGFGLWGLLVGEVGLALSVVTSMTLGIVVDDTVHFLSKYLRARRELGQSPENAVRYAFRTVGRALLVTSIVLVIGFFVLSLSSFELNSGMGLLTAAVIAFALIADFLFLPLLLMNVEGKSNEEEFISDPVADPSRA